MATIKKTTTKKSVSSKTAVTAPEAKAAAKPTAKEKHVYMFFNCNGNKDASSMNVRYNSETFADTAAGRKALLRKVEEEIAAGRISASDSEAVKTDILKGNPEQASSKLQYGDIECLTLVA